MKFHLPSAIIASLATGALSVASLAGGAKAPVVASTPNPNPTLKLTVPTPNPNATLPPGASCAPGFRVGTDPSGYANPSFDCYTQPFTCPKGYEIQPQGRAYGYIKGAEAYYVCYVPIRNQ